ncbi:MAG: hypothetical protein K2O67_04920, partial [Clostridia bacterium]|nr:hypothetical protein [Clostridia bacterium]
MAHYHCSNCNFDFSDSAGNTKLDTTVIKSTGHNYSDTVTAPTCENGGYTTHTCSKCNDSYTDTNVPANGHTWGEPKWQWAANYLTCSAKFTCSSCNKEQTETASVTHTSATASCTVAGDTTYTASVTFNNNSYTDSKVISGQTLPHTWQLLSESVPPDCENDGAGQFECSVCQKQETRAIDKLNHVEVDDAEVLATCTTDGKTAGKHCSRCNKTLDGLTVIPALGHNWTTDWDTDTTNHWHECTVCHEKKDDEAHTYDWVITKDPTEDEEGEKEEYCTVCQYASGNKETIAKLVKDPGGNGDIKDLPVLPPNQDYDLEIAVKESDSLYNIAGITKGYKVELFVVDGENRTEYDNNKKVTLMLVIPEGMEDEFTLYCRHGDILEPVDLASYTVNGKSVT